MIKVGFILENHMGHATYVRELKKQIEQCADIQPFWIILQQSNSNLNWTLDAGIQARKALRSLRDEKLDVLFFHTQTLAMLCQDWMVKIPTIISMDATPYQYDRMGAHYHHKICNPLIETIKSIIHKNCLRKAQHIITWSKWVKDSLVSDYKLSTTSISVVYPFINFEKWQALSCSSKSDTPTRILFVGNDFERKGGALLIEAFHDLNASFPNVELHIATKQDIVGNNISVYKELTQKDASFFSLFTECDIFCFPTHADTFGLIVAEASSAGLPVITTNIASFPELVENGVTGYLIEPNDTVALQSALRKLIENNEKRVSMGQAAQKHMEDIFNVERNFAQLLHIFQNVRFNKLEPKLGQKA